MINDEEELKKFEPCQDVDDAENAIYRQDLTDVVDLSLIHIFIFMINVCKKVNQ